MVNCNDTISHFCNYSLIHFNWDNLLTCQQISIDVIAKIMCMQRVCVDVHALCVNCTFIWSLKKKKKITWLNIINIARSCLSKSIAGEFHTIESVIRRMQGTPILLAARHFLVRKFPTFTFRFPLFIPSLTFLPSKIPLSDYSSSRRISLYFLTLLPFNLPFNPSLWIRRSIILREIEKVISMLYYIIFS